MVAKIAPKVLDEILKTNLSGISFPGLLQGNHTRDDAAVFDLGDGTAIVSTTDFFMPIVDDPIDFGKIASINAISDIYAMGACPLLAIAILGWPVEKLPPEVANQVIEGARLACHEAGIPLAGGHSIDCPEPVFGLAVTGRVQINQLKKNEGAIAGCQLFLTKPLGVGILSTAQKKKKLRIEHLNLAKDNMLILNRVGELFAKKDYVKAMTDVTGFGLLGHLLEMSKASQLSATIQFDNVPLIDKEILDYYIKEKCIPGGTSRNWDSYGKYVEDITPYQKSILCDPQTSGGLLVAIEQDQVDDFLELCSRQGLVLKSIGYFRKNEGTESLIKVI